MSKSTGDQNDRIKELEETLTRVRCEEARWRHALECAGHGVWDWNIHTSEVFFSDEWKRMLGFEPHEIVASLAEWAMRVHPDDLPEVKDAINAHLSGQSPRYCCEHRVRCKDDSFKWILDQGQVIEWDESGNPLRMVGTHTDVTQRRESEDRLRNSELRFNGFMRFAPLAAWATHLNGTLLYGNEPFASLLGRTVDEVRNQPLSSLFPESHAAEFQTNNELVLASGKPLQTQEQALLPSGNLGTFLVTKFPISEGFGGQPVIGGFAIDITAMKEQEASLIAATAKAEEASRAKDMFMATVSHELRTPMHAILGYSELALEGELSAEQRKNLQTILSSAESLLVLINDILDATRIASGKLDIHEIPTNIDGLVELTAALIQQRLLGKSVTFTAVIDPSLPKDVMGDPVRLRQILVNLLGNAAKFTDTGEIRLWIRRALPPKSETHFQLCVKDTGIGISPELLPTIFDPFIQGGPGTESRGGTGLGLSITRNLVQLMKGTIEVESRVGVGSLFVVTLPLRASLPTSMPPPSPSPAPPANRPCRILLAEDNVPSQILMRTMLEHSGAEVTTASDGSEAVQLALNGSFDLILMDCRMPLMDGFAATSAIRSAEAAGMTRRVPIVALTANTMPVDIARCHAAGMDAHLAKPIKKASLLAAVEHFALTPADVSEKELGVETVQKAIPSVASKAGESLLNAEIIGDILQAMEGKGSLFFSRLRESCSDLLAACYHHLKAGENASLREALHTLKGSLGSAGFEMASTTAAPFEDRLKRNPEALIAAEELERLETLLANSFAQLARDQ